MKTHDKKCRAAVKHIPENAVAWYLMAGYAYEVLGATLISDGCYDELCDILDEMLEDTGYIAHSHAHLVIVEDLGAATACGYVQYLPERVKHAAKAMLGELGWVEEVQ